MVRRNYYGVCLARDEGAYPIRTLTLNVEYHGALSPKFGPGTRRRKSVSKLRTLRIVDMRSCPESWSVRSQALHYLFWDQVVC
jgi:hypothetical protein